MISSILFLHLWEEIIWKRIIIRELKDFTLLLDFHFLSLGLLIRIYYHYQSSNNWWWWNILKQKIDNVRNVSEKYNNFHIPFSSREGVSISYSERKEMKWTMNRRLKPQEKGNDIIIILFHPIHKFSS